MKNKVTTIIITAIPLLILLGVAVAFTVIYSEPDPAVPPATTQEHAGEQSADPVDENRIFTLVNEERTANDLPAYTYDEVLEREVQQHAEQLCTAGINHDLFNSKVQTLEYRSEYISENLAHDFERSDKLVQAWIDSKGHYEAMMSTMYNETGIGIAECEDTIVVVQWFGINQ